jgi:uncharacterized coiled-coil DUF342 family protein
MTIEQIKEQMYMLGQGKAEARSKISHFGIKAYNAKGKEANEFREMVKDCQKEHDEIEAHLKSLQSELNNAIRAQNKEVFSNK